jgi:hypothetical protein
LSILKLNNVGIEFLTAIAMTVASLWDRDYVDYMALHPRKWQHPTVAT